MVVWGGRAGWVATKSQDISLTSFSLSLSLVVAVAESECVCVHVCVSVKVFGSQRESSKGLVDIYVAVGREAILF